MNDVIKKLQEQIEAEKRKIANCKHDFNEAYYDPETIKEPYGMKMVGMGSDVWHEYEGYRDVKKDRWSRKCKLCGYMQHTYTKKPVIKEYKPNFD
jgi:hypothetical protein